VDTTLLFSGSFLGFTLLFLVAGVSVAILITAIKHIWYGVPFVPTPQHLVDAMVELAELKPGDRVYDLGAGDGRTLITAVKAQPLIRATGFEGAPLVWLLGMLRTWNARNRIAFMRKNFYHQDLSDADVIFTYLSPEAMQKLMKKFGQELKPGTKIISHAFRLRELTPAAQRDVPRKLWGGSGSVFLYVWK
jgi:precorrin-6B methylase 2